MQRNMAKIRKPIHPGEIIREEFMLPMGKEIGKRVHPHAA